MIYDSKDMFSIVGLILRSAVSPSSSYNRNYQNIESFTKQKRVTLCFHYREGFVCVSGATI